MASHATGDGGIPARNAAARGLKRIMTLGGAYGTRNYTVKDLRDLKGRRVLVETLPFSPEEAAAAEEAAFFPEDQYLRSDEDRAVSPDHHAGEQDQQEVTQRLATEQQHGYDHDRGSETGAE